MFLMRMHNFSSIITYMSIKLICWASTGKMICQKCVFCYIVYLLFNQLNSFKMKKVEYPTVTLFFIFASLFF